LVKGSGEEEEERVAGSWCSRRNFLPKFGVNIFKITHGSVAEAQNISARLRNDAFFCLIGIWRCISGSVSARVAGILILYQR
jgi:hypothetical protein